LPINFLQLAFDIVGFTALLIFVFYAVRLLRSFRKGLLERGWKWVSAGAFLLAAAELPFLTTQVMGPYVASLLSDAGMLMRFSGLVCLILGFKAQYEIWRVDNKKSSSVPELSEVIGR
jgi:hypothetical protein